MVEMIQDILLSRWMVGLILVIAFLFLTHWSLRRLKEYAGYALGLLLGVFFVLVYISLGGGYTADDGNTRITLNIFEVFLATFFGLLFGVGIMFGLRVGTRYTRGASLQVALYTALNLILLFLAFIAGPLAARMIGIFALAIGIASLFAIVLFPSHQQEPPQAAAAQSAAAEGGSRLDAIRQQLRDKNQR